MAVVAAEEAARARAEREEEEEEVERRSGHVEVEIDDSDLSRLPLGALRVAARAETRAAARGDARLVSVKEMDLVEKRAGTSGREEVGMGERREEEDDVELVTEKKNLF